MNRETFPNVNFDMVVIKTIYPGGSSEEIEKIVTIPIEKKLRQVSGLDKVRSYNIENISVIVVYIDPDDENKKKIVEAP
jgi:multidrug efflux pump subunit AcrB